jgi:peptidoglycan/xylan/chitin deacetylase (PgdA/CDA1 family)
MTLMKIKIIALITSVLLVGITASSSLIAAPSAACGGGFVALTFDDGPSLQTSAMLDALKQHGLKATFFLIGRNVETHPEIAARIVREGHQVGNHTWDHRDLTTMTEAELDRQFRATNEIIQQVTGTRPTFARPPFGNSSTAIKNAMARNGLREVIWSQDSLDWKGATPESIVTQLARVPPGGTFLMHDRLPNAFDAIPGISAYLKSHGNTSPICAGRLEATNAVQPVLGWPGVFYFAHAVP